MISYNNFVPSKNNLQVFCDRLTISFLVRWSGLQLTHHKICAAYSLTYFVTQQPIVMVVT